MRGIKWLACAAALALGLASVFSGCGEQPPSVAFEESNLKKLALFYGHYQARHQGQLPADEKSFKEFIKQQQLLLDSQGIKDVDALFISERDKQPYVIIYAGEPLGTQGPGGSPVVAYEKQGVGGKRYVASSLGAVENVEDARFREWVK